MCPHYNFDEDSADHTMQSCPAWFDERTVLIGAIGSDLSLSGILGAIIAKKESWLAFIKFSEDARERRRRTYKGAVLSPGVFDPD